MESRSVDAGNAVTWYGFGWRIFMASPVTWMIIMLLFFFITLVLQTIPLLGQLVLTLIFPALSGGLMYGAKQAADGRPVEVAHFFMPLSDVRSRAPMLVLGVMMLGFLILLGVAAVIVVGGSAGFGVFGGRIAEMNDTTATIGAIGVGTALILLITLVYALITFAALAFAVPMVLFNDIAPVAAVKSSISASVKNIVPLSVFLLIYSVLALIAAMPFLLGFLVLAPVTAAALYASYIDIYPTETVDSEIIPA